MSQIPIFVINLDEEVQRLAAVRQELSKHNLRFERVAAIKGADLSDDEKRRCYKRPLFRRPLTNGEIGCFASHLAIYKLIVERDLSKACILEDDVEMSKDAIDWLKTTSPMPANAHLLKLEGLNRPKAMCLPIMEYGSRTITFTPRASFGTAAYVITQVGARQALKALVPMRSPFDHALFEYWNNGLNIYEVHPFPIRQSDVESVILDERLKFMRQHKKTQASKFARNVEKAFIDVRRFAYHVGIFGFTFQKMIPVSHYDS